MRSFTFRCWLVALSVLLCLLVVVRCCRVRCLRADSPCACVVCCQQADALVARYGYGTPCALAYPAVALFNCVGFRSAERTTGYRWSDGKEAKAESKQEAKSPTAAAGSAGAAGAAAPATGGAPHKA